MAPTLHHGQLQLGRRWGRPRVGQIIVVVTPEKRFIKRLIKSDEQGLWLAGDNASASTDSRSLGPFPPASCEAIII